MSKVIKKVLSAILYTLYYSIITALLYFVVAGRTLTDWYDETFGTRFREIVYTFNLGLTGADTSFMNEAVKECQLDLIKATVIVMLLILVDVILFRKVGMKRVTITPEARGRHGLRASGTRHQGETIGVQRIWKRSPLGHVLKGTYHISILLIGILLAKPVYAYADQVLEVSDFVKSKLTYTKIYDTEYVKPNKVKISNTKAKKRNVIIVYMESMETTYASKELGGFQNKNLMPNLYQLQQENIAFGDKNGMKGTHNPVGTTWTTASLLASSSGVPFAFNIGMNKNEGRDDSDEFAKGVTTIGDILAKKGYNQEFICGSDSTFGRKKKLFEEHGNYKIFDYYSAIDGGYIDKNYKVWWGMEDQKMYGAAKDEILKLANKGKPFNCTLLTVDTHHVGGYRCSVCPSGNGSKTANVVACADQQVADFVNWCKQQNFYDNTTIVILGDHPRMDKKLVKGVDKVDREALDVFINSASPYRNVNKNRTATTVDLFPTILSSMGYSIQGDRLGLGTNLFSPNKTLAEELGYNEFNNELGRNSRFYHRHFQ